MCVMSHLSDFKSTLVQWMQIIYFNSEVITWTEEVFTINKEVITSVCCFCYFYLIAKYEKKEFYNLSYSSVCFLLSVTYVADFLHFSRNTMETFHQVCWKKSLFKWMFFYGFLLSITSLKFVLYPPSLINWFAIVFSTWVPYVPSSAIMCHHLFTARWSGDKSVTEKHLMKPQDSCITSPYMQVFSAGSYLNSFWSLWN